MVAAMSSWDDWGVEGVPIAGDEYVVSSLFMTLGASCFSFELCGIAAISTIVRKSSQNGVL